MFPAADTAATRAVCCLKDAGLSLLDDVTGTLLTLVADDRRQGDESLPYVTTGKLWIGNSHLKLLTCGISDLGFTFENNLAVS